MAQRLKRLPPMRGTWVKSLGWDDPLEKEMMEKEMEAHSSILAWRIPWTEEPEQRVGRDFTFTFHFPPLRPLPLPSGSLPRFPERVGSLFPLNLHSTSPLKVITCFISILDCKHQEGNVRICFTFVCSLLPPKESFAHIRYSKNIS